MDPFMVRLTQIIHEEKIEKYQKLAQFDNGNVTSAESSWLPRLKEAFASVAEKVTTKTQTTAVESTSRS